MDSGKKITRILFGLGTVLLQLVMTQVVTFLVSLPLAGMGEYGKTRPILFAVMLGTTFSAGVFLAGWLALKWGWISTAPKYPARLVATLIGAYLPLILALIFYRTLEPGNPFFFISMLASILGFHIPGWIGRK